MFVVRLEKISSESKVPRINSFINVAHTLQGVTTTSQDEFKTWIDAFITNLNKIGTNKTPIQVRPGNHEFFLTVETEKPYKLIAQFEFVEITTPLTEHYLTELVYPEIQK